MSPVAAQKYVTVHTSHGPVTLAFENSGDAQQWFAALRDAVAALKEVLQAQFCVLKQGAYMAARRA